MVEDGSGGPERCVRENTKIAKSTHTAMTRMTATGVNVPCRSSGYWSLLNIQSVCFKIVEKESDIIRR